MKRRTKLIAAASLTIVAAGAAFLTGCVHRSGGEWMIDSAARPEGWPDITPVNEVEVKSYPTTRAASVTREAAGGGTGPMFNELFNHIKRNDIAMTAPVDMGYAPASDTAGAGDAAEPQLNSMTFLYRTTDLGEPGPDGAVLVRDLPSTTYATTGLRGSYSTRNYERALERLRSWLDAQSEWAPAGEPRYLGYNGPFTAPFLKYAEVQIPVRPAD